MNKHRGRCPAGPLLLILCLLAGGCSRLRTEYGQSYDVEGQQSIAGFGVLRDFYRRQGWSDRTVARLSERAERADLVLTARAEVDFLLHWAGDLAADLMKDDDVGG